MNNSILRFRTVLVVLGTVVVAHASAAALDFTHKLSFTTGIDFVRELFNASGSILLLVVAAGLIVLGSALQRKLIKKSAPEQTQKTATALPKGISGKPPEKATPLGGVAPQRNTVASEPSNPMPMDAGV